MTFDLVLWDRSDPVRASSWGDRFDDADGRWDDRRPATTAMVRFAQWFEQRCDLARRVEVDPLDVTDAGFAYLSFGGVPDDDQVGAIEATCRDLGIRCIWPAAE